MKYFKDKRKENEISHNTVDKTEKLSDKIG